MIQSQNNIFSQSFYWKFQAPNKEELSTFVLAQESGDPVPWGKLCSVKMTQILDDILPMMQPSINKFCEEVDQRMLMSMNRPWVSHYEKGDYQEPHDHNDCDVVGVFFPEYLEGYSQFYFLDRHVDLSSVWKRVLPTEQTHIPKIEAGDILFFPGHMLHGVSSHKHDNIRKTLSCNFWVKQIAPKLL